MTVSVTLSDGRVEQYMRFGDAYVEHDNGRLDVVRTGAGRPFSYGAGEWAAVEGDQKKWNKRKFWWR